MMKTCKRAFIHAFTLTMGLAAVLNIATADDGSHTAEFLSHGVGARALGMGGAFVSIADDATAAYWNPAGLASVEKHAFSIMYSDSFGAMDGGILNKGIVEYNFVNYVHQFGGIGSVGISWIRLGVDDIPFTTFTDTNGNGLDDDFLELDGVPGKSENDGQYFEPPTVTGYFSNTDNALLISYARKVSAKLFIGANYKLLKQSIFENVGTGNGLDIGAIAGPFVGIRFGAMLEDATGTQVRWDTNAEPTFTRSPRLRFGASYHRVLPAIGSITIGADTQMNHADLDPGSGSNGSLFRFGAEYWLLNIVAFRVGTEAEKLALGAGLRLRMGEATMFADYAFNAHDIGNSQRISISGTF
ncbi:MAG: PorV/PorQ family protein [Candidatus Poribacteria bacterium]|nr:PorV/PorQ family protein [Candidatus Poribacteria bacterium]